MCSQIQHDIPAENVPSRIDVPKEQTDGNKMNEPRIQLKKGRLAGSRDKNPRKNLVEKSCKVPGEPDTEKCLKEDISGKVEREPDTERCLKEGINGKVPEEPDTEKCLKEGINEKGQDEPNKDDPDDEKGTEKYEISINYTLNEKL